ncbi:hypothetical protein RB595_005185 [Gaeumannomyces hyphopodioides]
MSLPDSHTPGEIIKIPTAKMEQELVASKIKTVSTAPTIPRSTVATLTVATPTAPACVYCREKTQRFITRSSNRNGNAGRPYYKCVPCNKFARFDDERGNDRRNPPCDGCGHPSKRQVAGGDARVPGGVHYVCSQGTCDFYKPHLNKDGVQLAVVDAELLRALVSLKLV